MFLNGDEKWILHNNEECKNCKDKQDEAPPMKPKPIFFSNYFSEKQTKQKRSAPN